MALTIARPATERPSSAKSSTSDGFGARSHAVRAAPPLSRRAVCCGANHASFAHSRLARAARTAAALVSCSSAPALSILRSTAPADAPVSRKSAGAST